MDHQHNHHHGHHQPDEQPAKPMQEHVHHKQQDDRTGHDEHAGHHTENFLKRFWICLLITVPILLLSHMIQQWAGFSLRFAGDNYVLLVLSSFVYLYNG